ncbi:PD-(D/E)XK nuclease superfamily protein [Skeletonema marinoi]|uniref:PD-(D/E)XK nuclease superfamily protein n=1 Tax=Skeletonema marinoi TaxID=267567 RepID=A0AAD8XXI7_9STRA|nr:PD-(D/E)XK nuclease superfamily protein [Skeletonema marinoi]
MMLLKRSCHCIQSKQWTASTSLLLWCTVAAVSIFYPTAAFINTEMMMLRVVSRRSSYTHHLSRSAYAPTIFSTRQLSSSSSHSEAASAQVATLLDPYEILRDLKFDKIPLPNKLSPTSLESFTKCNQAFFFQYILKLKPDPPMTPELARGIICHKALEDVFELAPPQRTLVNLQNLFRKEWSSLRGDRESNNSVTQTKEYNAESYDSLFRIVNDHDDDADVLSNESFPFDINAEIDWGQSSLQLLKNYYELEDPRNVTPLMREMWVNAKFPTEDDSFVVRGKIDRIDLISSNSGAILSIIDYKTGKKPHFKYATATNERIANEQFWKMKVYALILWKMILQTETLEQRQRQQSEEVGKTVDYRYGLAWELRQKLLQSLGYENEQQAPKWTELLTLESLRLMYLTSHLDDMAANYDTPPDAPVGKAKCLDFSLNEFMSVLDQTENEVMSIQKQIKELVDMQDPKAWHHCNWKYCNCHEMRDRFIDGTVSHEII